MFVNQKWRNLVHNWPRNRQKKMRNVEKGSRKTKKLVTSITSGSRREPPIYPITIPLNSVSMIDSSAFLNKRSSFPPAVIAVALQDKFGELQNGYSFFRELNSDVTVQKIGIFWRMEWTVDSSVPSRRRQSDAGVAGHVRSTAASRTCSHRSWLHHTILRVHTRLTNRDQRGSVPHTRTDYWAQFRVTVILFLCVFSGNMERNTKG